MEQFYLYTINFQDSEFQLTDTFLTILRPALKDSKTITNYCYTCEKGQSLKRHLHLMVGFKKTKSKNDPLKQFMNSAKFKEFRHILKDKLTNPNIGFDNRKVADTESDFLKVLGYVCKETDPKERCFTFTNEQVLKAIEYYYQTQHIDKSQPCKDNWTILTGKNVNVHIEDWLNKNPDKETKDFQPDYIQEMMVKERYCWHNLTYKNIRRAFAEVIIARGKHQFLQHEYVPVLLDDELAKLRADNLAFKLRLAQHNLLPLDL